MLYRERLWPSPGLWIFVLLISAMTILVAFPISAAAAIIAPIVVFALITAWVFVLSTTIAVTADVFVVGRATIERRYLGRARALVKDDAVHARGPGLDVRSFLHIRFWVRDLVSVELNDPQDPTPRWLISTRHPEKLADALNS